MFSLFLFWKENIPQPHILNEWTRYEQKRKHEYTHKTSTRNDWTGARVNIVGSKYIHRDTEMIIVQWHDFLFRSSFNRWYWNECSRIHHIQKLPMWSIGRSVVSQFINFRSFFLCHSTREREQWHNKPNSHLLLSFWPIIQWKTTRTTTTKNKCFHLWKWLSRYC